jgi:hypothetical protein
MFKKLPSEVWSSLSAVSNNDLMVGRFGLLFFFFSSAAMSERK